MTQQIEIIIALVIYFGICIGLGIYSMYKSRNADTHDYLTAGGNVGWIVNAVCIFAAFNSGGALMGNLGLSYASSWGYMNTLCVGTATGMFFSAMFVAGPLRNLRIATVPEFLRKRYHLKALNIIAPVLLICTITAYLMAQMKVAGMLGEKILGLPYEWGVIAIAVVYVFYTSVGGMFSVTLTDCFQGFIMLFVLTLASIFCVQEFGGFTNLYESAAAARPEFVQNDNGIWINYVGGFMGWCFVNTCLPHSIMRVFTAKDEKSGRMALGVGALLIGGFAVIANVIIPAAGVMLHGGADLGAETDYVFMDVIDAIFPEWFQAIVYAGVFAAVMSSVSGMLLSIGSACSYDLIETLRPETDAKTVKKISKITIVVFGAISAILALNPPALLTILYSSAMGVLASGLSAPLVLGLWWKRMNKWGALSSLVVGAGLWISLFLFSDLPGLAPSAIAIPCAWATAVIISLLTQPSTDEELIRVSIAHQRMLTDEER